MIIGAVPASAEGSVANNRSAPESARSSRPPGTPAPGGNTSNVKPGTCKPVLIMRYLGTTPDSSALTPMLISLCQQVLILFSFKESQRIFKTFITDFLQLYVAL